MIVVIHICIRLALDQSLRHRFERINMESKYRKIIQCMLDINPSPSDRQFHCLADALGVDHEELESVAYQMLAEHERSSNIVDVLASPNLSHTDRALSGLVDEDFLPYYDAALLDGGTDTSAIELLQESTFADGGFSEYDKSVTTNDGPVLPNLGKKLAARLLAASKTPLKNIKRKLNALDLEFVESDNARPVLHMEIEHPDDIQDTIDELQKQGFKFRIDKGVTSKNSFAIKAPGGLTLQRTGTHLRIFYS